MSWILNKVIDLFFGGEVMDKWWDFEEENWYDNDAY